MPRQEQAPSEPQAISVPIPGFFISEATIRDYAKMRTWDPWGALFRHWLTVAFTMLLFGAIGAVIGLIATPQYRAEAVLAPAEDDQTAGLGALSDQFGALGALAGIRLPADSNRTIIALAILRSDGFAERYIQSNGLMPVLLESRSGLFGSRDPTIHEAIRKFRREVLFVEDDATTRLVRLTVQWKDAGLAAQWANAIIAQLNEELRAAAIAEATKSIDYLQREVEKTNVVDIRNAIYGLIENQAKIAMVANVREEYALRIVDAARVPDRPISPKKLMLIAVGVALGGFFGWVIALLRSSNARSTAD